jgi:UDPglucose 6-dehydrogenase
MSNMGTTGQPARETARLRSLGLMAPHWGDVMKISVVGLGKLGAPIVAVLASRGYDVVGLDTNPTFVDKINNHVAPVEEPRLQELLTAHKARVSATMDWTKAVADSDVTTVIVPTPSGADGAFRNDYVLSVMDEVGRALAKKPGYHLVVVNSTTMPGSVGGPIRQRLEHASGRKVGPNLGLCYNPEFIALGDVINGLLHPDFVLIGESDTKAGDLLEGIYRNVVGPDANIARMNFVNAELTKISVNTYVTMKISFANMLGEICDRLEGADVSVVADAIGRDTRIGKKYLKPAVGYGGPCFPRDTIAFGRVAHMTGGTADLALATDQINRRQISRLTEMIGELMPARGIVAVLGLSYKPNTPVIEESQGVMLAKSLNEAGFAVVAHDPMAGGPAQMVLGNAVRVLPSAREALAQADAAVIITPWPEYAEISPDWVQTTRIRFIVDCWRQLRSASFTGNCRIVCLGHQETIAAAGKRLAAE